MELIIESVGNLPEKIKSAMKQRKVVKIWYEPVDDPKGGLTGYRDIEIFAYGVNRFHNEVIYAWLRNDFSQTKNSGRPNDALRWRMFRLDGIQRFTPTIQTYEIMDTFVKSKRPRLNKSYNRSLIKVFSTVYDNFNNTQKETETTNIYDKVNNQYTLEENKK